MPAGSDESSPCQEQLLPSWITSDITRYLFRDIGNPTLEAPLIERQIWAREASGNQAAGAKTIYMPRSPAICRELHSLPSSVGLAVECLNGSFAFYRIRGSILERIQDMERTWTEVPSEDILQHLVLHTPVAVWLESRMVLKPADWVKPYFHTE